MSFTNEEEGQGFGEFDGPEEGSSVGTLVPIDHAALGAVERAGIDMQISTAKAYPRSVDKALKLAQSLACLDAKTAAGMFYTIKRSGKKIMGPSTRLAEIVASCWGNLRIDAGVESADATHITAVATCFDLETNVAVRIRTQRRITTSEGKRYNDDMIVTTGNAATSIALRNSVFRVVPRVFVDRLDQMARVASTGKGTLEEKRAGAKKHFANLGVTDAELLAFVGVRGWDDVSLEQVIELQGAATAIKDQVSTVDELFRPEKQSAGAAAMNAAAQGQEPARGRGGRKAAPPPPEDSDASPTDGEISNLQDLMGKAGDAGVEFDSEGLELAIHDKRGRPIRDGIRELNKALAAKVGEQGSFGMKA